MDSKIVPRLRTRNFDSEVVHNAVYLLFLGMSSTLIEMKGSSVFLHGLPFEDNYSPVTVTNLIDILLFYVLTDSVRLIARAVLDWSLRAPDCEIKSEDAVNVLSYVSESSSKSLTSWSSAALLIMVMAINVLPNFALQFGGSRNYTHHNDSRTCKEGNFMFTAVGGRVGKAYTVTGVEMAYRINIDKDVATEAAVIDKNNFLLVPTQIEETSNFAKVRGHAGRRRNFYIRDVPTVEITNRNFEMDNQSCNYSDQNWLWTERSKKAVTIRRLNCSDSADMTVVSIAVSELGDDNKNTTRYKQTIGVQAGRADISFQTSERGRNVSVTGAFNPNGDMTRSVRDFSKLPEDLAIIALNLAGFKFTSDDDGAKAKVWKALGVMIAVKAAALGNVLDGGTSTSRIPKDGQNYSFGQGYSCVSVEALDSQRWYWEFRLGLVVIMFSILTTIAFDGSVVGGSLWQSAALLKEEVDTVSWACAPEWLIDSIRRRGAGIETHPLENKHMTLEVVAGLGLANCYHIDGEVERLHHLRLVNKDVSPDSPVREREMRIPSIFRAFIPIIRASIWPQNRKLLGWARVAVIITIFVPATVLIVVAGLTSVAAGLLAGAKLSILRGIERWFSDSVDGVMVSMIPAASGTATGLVLPSPPITLVRNDWASIMVAGHSKSEREHKSLVRTRYSSRAALKGFENKQE
jgi:hypothetical protein